MYKQGTVAILYSPITVLTWLIALSTRSTVVCMLRHLLPYRSKKELSWSPQAVVWPVLYLLPLLIVVLLPSHLTFLSRWVPALDNRIHSALLGMAMCMRLAADASLEYCLIVAVVSVLAIALFPALRANVSLITVSVLLGFTIVWHYVSSRPTTLNWTMNALQQLWHPVPLVTTMYGCAKAGYTRCKALCTRRRHAVPPVEFIPLPEVPAEPAVDAPVA
jgi:Flp pilus assembly pilin Flp